jgi:hypothetical protein
MTVTAPGATFITGQQYTFVGEDSQNDTWLFRDAELRLPPDKPRIVNPAVPGDITLSAYNGIKIAASAGFGIKFPDDTVQTTAYNGQNLVTLDGTQTISNKTILNPQINIDSEIVSTFTNPTDFDGFQGGTLFGSWDGTTKAQIIFVNPSTNLQNISANNESAGYTFRVPTTINLDGDYVPAGDYDIISSKLDGSAQFIVDLSTNGATVAQGIPRRGYFVSSGFSIAIINNGSISPVEISYLDGATSNIQDQLNLQSNSNTETSFTVNGGTLGTQPTFNGAPLFTGSYTKSGDLVHFQIQVDMDNITSFGTGQYYVDLPFPAKYGYKFREGCLHDVSITRDFEIGGHVYAGQSRLTLTSTDAQGNTVFDIPFVYNNPIPLTTEDNFHISGTYIIG